MSVIALIVSLILLILSLFFKKKNKSISPMALFFALWSFILFLSVLNLYNIYKPSNEAYFLIILMLAFFYMGSFFGMVIKINKKNKNKNIKFQFSLFYILSFFVILFNVIDIIMMMKLYFNGTPMWQIRNWTLEAYGSSNLILDRRSFIEECFRTMILTPFSTIIPPITAYYFFNSKENKIRHKLFINSLIILITSSLSSGGGRLAFIYYFGCFLLAFVILYKDKKALKDVIKKYKKIIISILIFGILVVIIFTTIRTGKGNFIKQIYTYFALPPTLLSEWLPDIKNTEYTYGMTSFFGVHSYFFRTLDTIGFDELIPEIYNDAYANILKAEEFRETGYGIGNAFVTPIYYFFVDGGYVFVVITSMLFGYIISRLYKKFEENINVRSFTIYALTIYGLFLTFARIQTIVPAYIISFIFATFILRPVTQDKNKNDKTGDFNYEKKDK